MVRVRPGEGRYKPGTDPSSGSLTGHGSRSVVSDSLRGLGAELGRGAVSRIVLRFDGEALGPRSGVSRCGLEHASVALYPANGCAHTAAGRRAAREPVRAQATRPGDRHRRRRAPRSSSSRSAHCLRPGLSPAARPEPGWPRCSSWLTRAATPPRGPRLADRARQELRAAGACPRRTALSGLDALTPAEDVSPPGRDAFHKLGISTRAELPPRLRRRPGRLGASGGRCASSRS